MIARLWRGRAEPAKADAYLQHFDATVVDRRDDSIALDRTAFYPTGGGQPHDVGTLGGFVSVMSMDDMLVRTEDQPEGTGEYFTSGSMAIGIPGRNF